jgi:hypothetical protein
MILSTYLLCSAMVFCLSIYTILCIIPKRFLTTEMTYVGYARLLIMVVLASSSGYLVYYFGGFPLYFVIAIAFAYIARRVQRSRLRAERLAKLGVRV